MGADEVGADEVGDGSVDPAREARLRGLYEAFNRRDVEAVLAAMAPDVDWPDVRGGTRAVGRDAVRGYWTRQFAEIDPHVEPTAVVAVGDRVVVDVHQVIRGLDGAVLADGHVAHAYRFDGDLVAAMHVHPTVDDVTP